MLAELVEDEAPRAANAIRARAMARAEGGGADRGSILRRWSHRQRSTRAGKDETRAAAAHATRHGETRALNYDADSLTFWKSRCATDATTLPMNWPGAFRRATVIRRDEPLAKHTTLRVGGPADVYVEPASEEDLAGVVKCCGAHSVPFFMIGPRLESARARRRFSRCGDLPGARRISARSKLPASGCIAARARS